MALCHLHNVGECNREANEGAAYCCTKHQQRGAHLIRTGRLAPHPMSKAWREKNNDTAPVPIGTDIAAIVEAAVTAALAPINDRLDTLIEQAARGQVIQPAALTDLRQIASDPIFDEDIEFEIGAATSTQDNNPTWNFIIAGARNVYGNFDNLPADIVAYGIDTGLINAQEVKSPKTSGPKAMSVPQFDAPDFDDFEDIDL